MIDIEKLKKKYTKKYFKRTTKKIKDNIVWQVGYKPLKPPPEESMVDTFKKAVRQSSNEKMAELENIMFELGLYNRSGEYAKRLVYKEISEKHYYTMWNFPRGMSIEDYISYKRKFEDSLTAQVNIKKEKGNLYIEVIEGVIPNKVNYKFNINEYKDYIIPVPMGYDQTGLRVWDLTEKYHIIIAGVIGGGKSVFMKCLLDAIMQNDNVVVYVIDLAMVDFEHTKNKVLFGCTLDEAELYINYLVQSNIERRELLTKHDCADILEYNEKFPENKLKHKVMLIDEAAFTSPEMSTDKETKERRKALQNHIAQLITTSRKAGIHLIIGLQRPEKDIMPMVIKSNIPGKVAFKTENTGTSRTILGNDDAYHLPNIKGRCIIQHGVDQYEVQGMYLDHETARKRMKKIQERKDEEFVCYLEQLQSIKEQYKEKRLLPRRSNRK